VAYNPFHPSDLRKIISLFMEGRRALIDLVREQGIEHCLALWAIPSGIWARGAWKLLGVPYSVWALGSDINQWGHRPVIGRIIRQVLRDADHRFADGLALARKVEALSGRDCLFLPTTRPLGLEGGAPVVLDSDRVHFLFIGRWERVKGIDVLVEAMRLLRGWDANPCLHVLGGGSLEPELRQRVEEHQLQDTVLLHGSVPTDELIGYLLACHAVVIPSRSESIPLVFGEAVQAGKPLIVTDVGDMGDLVREYGGGRVVPPENPEALAEAMLSFCRDPEAIPFRSPELARLFDVQAMVDHLMEQLF